MKFSWVIYYSTFTKNVWLTQVFASKVQLKVFFMYGTTYREVISSQSFDWCRLMTEKDRNVVNDHFLEIIRRSAPDILHPCPYTVILNDWFWLSLHFFHNFRTWPQETRQLTLMAWLLYFLLETTKRSFISTAKTKNWDPLMRFFQWIKRMKPIFDDFIDQNFFKWH